jgi:hypothetical protein
MVFSPGKVFRAATRGWHGPFARPEMIIKVAVHDDVQLLRMLDAERDLAAFRQLWATFVEVDCGSYTWQREQPYYKLAIESLGLGGRIDHASWYYFPGGYLKLLAVMRAIWVAPLYRAAAPETFEALLRGDV